MASKNTLHTALEDLRAERERVEDGLADRVLELLDQHDLGDLVRRRCALVTPAPEVTRPPPTPTAKEKPPAPGQPATRGPPATEAFWRQLLAEALARPNGSRGGLVKEILSKQHRFPDGVERRVTKTAVYGWIKRLEGIAPPPPADDERPTEDPKAERKRLQLEGVIGNPVELGKEYDATNRRKTACPAYNGCLSFAVRRKWESWCCSGCTGPGPQGSANATKRRFLPGGW